MTSETQPVPISIRPETPADYDGIRDVNAQAFGRPLEARLVEALRETPEYIPELSLVAEREGVIVGHILFSPVHLREDAAIRLLGIGPVAVHPDYQRQGIGIQLMYAGLERARVLDYRGVVLVGHPTYYPRFGFRPASTYGLKYTLPIADEVFMALPLRDGALDGVSGTVVFPPAFDNV